MRQTVGCRCIIWAPVLLGPYRRVPGPATPPGRTAARLPLSVPSPLPATARLHHTECVTLHHLSLSTGGNCTPRRHTGRCGFMNGHPRAARHNMGAVNGTWCLEASGWPSAVARGPWPVIWDPCRFCPVTSCLSERVSVSVEDGMSCNQAGAGDDRTIGDDEM